MYYVYIFWPFDHYSSIYPFHFNFILSCASNYINCIFNVHAYVDTILFILVVETHPLVNSLESVYVSMITELLYIGYYSLYWKSVLLDVRHLDYIFFPWISKYATPFSSGTLCNCQSIWLFFPYKSHVFLPR